MAKHLIVSEAFGDYAKGDRITDAAKVAEILDSPSAVNVLPINVPDAPAPSRGSNGSGDQG
ncbi:MAG: hypothetical protein GAK28_04918 [Luteibacter sp.]|uniref:hypothetical protein n=1 Tax=Luteibacter sp. TaxID=1886636 RepID=UPI001385DFCF|nr:hypothetical protein [Luteibacter sp.]KAF1003117.1 MAG: hypothetical protein GAK28_04918 [Luteibacter sp.]